MKKVIIHEEANPQNHPRHALDEICRKGAQRMLMQALELEVTEYLRDQQEKCEGKSLVTRHGALPKRMIQMTLPPTLVHSNLEVRGLPAPSRAAEVARHLCWRLPSQGTVRTAVIVVLPPGFH